MLELSDAKTRTSKFNGNLGVGQLLVTTQSAYFGVEWFHGNTENFAVVNLQTWTLEDYADLMNSGVNQALLMNWRLVHRHQDQTMVLAMCAEEHPAG